MFYNLYNAFTNLVTFKSYNDGKRQTNIKNPFSQMGKPQRLIKDLLKKHNQH